MRFRVNEGQSPIPHQPGDGTPRRMLVPGDEVDGPPSWVEEFAGRMSAINEDGHPVDPKVLAVPELATATKAHERVGLLEQLIKTNPGHAETLQPQLDEARAQAEADQEEATRVAAQRDRLIAEGLIHDHGGVGVQVLKQGTTPSTPPTTPGAPSPTPGPATPPVAPPAATPAAPGPPAAPAAKPVSDIAHG